MGIDKQQFKHKNDWIKHQKRWVTVFVCICLEIMGDNFSSINLQHSTQKSLCKIMLKKIHILLWFNFNFLAFFLISQSVERTHKKLHKNNKTESRNKGRKSIK